MSGLWGFLDLKIYGPYSPDKDPRKNPINPSSVFVEKEMQLRWVVVNEVFYIKYLNLKVLSADIWSRPRKDEDKYWEMGLSCFYKQHKKYTLKGI